MSWRARLEPSFIDRAQLQPHFPTEFHSSDFWEALGRVIGSFGYLEEVLARALFVITGSRHVPGRGPEDDFRAWLHALDKNIRLTLFPLSHMLENELREDARFDDIDTLPIFESMSRLTRIRNVLSHASWRAPDGEGKSHLFHVDKTLGAFEDPVDLEFLQQVQSETAQLCCDIMDLVTGIGLPFSGKRSNRLPRQSMRNSSGIQHKEEGP